MRSKYGRSLADAKPARSLADGALVLIILAIVVALGVAVWYAGTRSSARQQPQYMLYLLLDVSGSTNAYRYQDARIVFGLVDRLPANTRVTVLEYSTTAIKTFDGKPEEAASMMKVAEKFKAERRKERGTHPGTALKEIAREIRGLHGTGPQRIGIVVITDGEDTDQDSEVTRSAAADLAADRSVKAAWFAPVTAEFRLDVEKSVEALGNRLITSGDAGDVNDGIDRFLEKFTGS